MSDIEQIYNSIKSFDLAANGGDKVRKEPMPKRNAFGPNEKNYLNKAIALYQDQEVDPGYQGAVEAEYCEYFVNFMGGQGYADAVATGTASVFLAIAALNLPKNSSVIVSPITDPGTISAIIMNGLKPKLADIRFDDYNMTSSQIEPRIDKDVSAVLLVHASGKASDADEIAKLCKRNNLAFIEDCSQAHGALIKGKQVGTFSDISAFSTMYRKNSISGGCGGIVYSKNKDIFHNALAHADRGKPRWKKNFDDRNPNEFLFPALNWHTNELSCAIGISSLKRLSDTIRKRQSFVSELFTLMSELDDSIFSIRSWSPSDSPFVVPIFVDQKKTKFTKIEIANFLKAEGIDLNPHYQYLVSDWHWVKPYLYDDFIPKQALENINNSFCLYLNENYSIKEAIDVLAAMMKVEKNVLKKNKKKFFSIEKIN